MTVRCAHSCMAGREANVLWTPRPLQTITGPEFLLVLSLRYKIAFISQLHRVMCFNHATARVQSLPLYWTAVSFQLCNSCTDCYEIDVEPFVYTMLRVIACVSINSVALEEAAATSFKCTKSPGGRKKKERKTNSCIASVESIRSDTSRFRQ